MAVLDEKYGRLQCQKMVRMGDLTGPDAAGRIAASVTPDTVSRNAAVESRGGTTHFWDGWRFEKRSGA